MKMTETGRKWTAIAFFYVIAVLIRAIALKYENLQATPFIVWLWNWSRGIGPCIGAIATVLIFKRKFYCTITGTSILKSIISVLLPFAICFFIDHELSFILIGFIIYSFLEEVGWRGYLQGELMDINPVLRMFIIGVMWFFWHIAIGFNIGSLIFFAVLLLGTWGIGCIARDTKSLILCACFHTLWNFYNQGPLFLSTTLIILYVSVIVSWFLIWYVPWQKLVSRTFH